MAEALGPKLEALLDEILELGAGEHAALEDGVFTFALPLKHGEYDVAVHDLAEVGLLMVTAHAPAKIDEARFGAMMEFLVRANYDMNLVTFDLDLNTGALISRAAMPTEDGVIGKDQLANLMISTLASLDMAWPAIQAVNAGEATPVEALPLIDRAE
jgi:hypothetical protein